MSKIWKHIKRILGFSRVQKLAPLKEKWYKLVEDGIEYDIKLITKGTICNKYYFYRNKLHNFTGPAIKYYVDDTLVAYDFYLNGRELTEKEYQVFFSTKDIEN